MCEDDALEPKLSQILGDPLTLVLMRSDGVDPGALRDLISEARRRIAEAGANPSRPPRSRR